MFTATIRIHVCATGRECLNFNPMLMVVRADWIDLIVDEQVKSCHSAPISVPVGLQLFTIVLSPSRVILIGRRAREFIA